MSKTAPKNDAADKNEKKNTVIAKSSIGKTFCDYKNADDLRRLLTPNGRIQSSKRTGLSAGEQRLATQAIKRARFMAILPFTDATL